MKRALLSASSGICLLGLAGCGLLEQQVRTSSDVASHTWIQVGNPAPVESPDEGRRAVEAYIVLVDVLRRSDANGRHPIFEQAFQAYRQNPTADTRLRLALVLTETQQTSAELSVARDLIADVVADAQPIPPLVRKFAEARMHEVDQRLALYQEIKSLKVQLSTARQEQRDAQDQGRVAAQRLRSVEAALAEANAKLQAVMNIEKDIGPTRKGTFP